jgi:hypothetical protein
MSNEVEFTLEGLNPKQKALCDIMWAFEEFTEVEAFMATLPKRERIECEGLIEMMRMAVVEQCYEGIRNTQEADQVIAKLRLTK